MCPDKKLTWFDDEQATVAAELVRQRWSDSYEAFSDVEASSHYNGSPIKVYHFLSGHTNSDMRFRHPQSGF